MAVKMVKILEKTVEDAKAEEFINGGGKVVEDIKEEKKEGKTKKLKRDDWAILSLRLPNQIVKMIDERRVKNGWSSRNSWIFLAIQKAIKEESEY